MPYKDPDRQREAQRKHYSENPDKYKSASRRALGQRRRLVQDAKDVPCADCGKRYPYYVMDFDHRPGEKKLGTVSWLMANRSVGALMEEMSKCDVVCANCHRERTHQRGMV